MVKLIPILRVELYLKKAGWLLLILTILLHAACATGQKLTDHTFEFNAMWDSHDIEILDYRYGESKQPGARAAEFTLERGKVAQQVSINGAMLRGDDLYVKWRIRSTGEVFEDTVDLSSRLPANIAGHRIRFIVKGKSLYVYLVTPKKIVPNPCTPLELRRSRGKLETPDNRIFSLYCSKQIIKLYPGQPEQLNIGDIK